MLLPQWLANKIRIAASKVKDDCVQVGNRLNPCLICRREYAVSSSVKANHCAGTGHYPNYYFDDTGRCFDCSDFNGKWGTRKEYINAKPSRERRLPPESDDALSAEIEHAKSTLSRQRVIGDAYDGPRRQTYTLAPDACIAASAKDHDTKKSARIFWREHPDPDAPLQRQSRNFVIGLRETGSNDPQDIINSEALADAMG